MFIRFNARVLILLSVFVFSGCASDKIVKTYEGAELPSNAISILTTPENITLLSVNDAPVSQYLLSNLRVNYGLKEGDNLIVFKYESLWGKAKKDKDTGKRVEVVESEPLAVVLTAKPGVNYSFNAVAASNIRQAKQMASNPVVGLVDDKKNIVAESTSLAIYQSSIEQKEQVQKSEEANALVGEKRIPESVVKQEQSITPLARLKQVWASTNEEERKAFMVWVFQK